MNPIQNTVNNSANAATATGVMTGAATATAKASSWLDENSITIGVMCTIMSVLLAFTFHIINTMMNARFERQKANIEKAALIARLIDEGKTEQEINYILKSAGVEHAI